MNQKLKPHEEIQGRTVYKAKQFLRKINWDTEFQSDYGTVLQEGL